ncbi:hypothetical protein JH06_0094 [Blastocystis sp. subtype 4]|uniref:hypothetical protein n=1 Tax=Blastocystis sp. subtype 4 TaxID=944170 RepID=UPI00071132C8|nr:hypothetical protein JH06_0094 [Blastocystis sp. subtype 4]KNB46562.1 hypothetical protein JH06_0094 [Blastocystis sp. subtype 4]|eukprot:XP_014530005.1 hypothetical protein JH06_0094 [Blastocystis sp. subtype 4]
MYRLYTYYIEKTINYPLYRWVVLVLMMALYVKRILSTHGFYLISYTLGLYLLNLLLGFLSPLDVYDDDTAELPTRDATEYRPFIRRVPEFKKESMQAVVLCFFLTFIPFLDIPVFWPILVMYFFMLFFITMRDRIAHMIRYRYLPWSHGKKRYSRD